jgi:hypothetical protein
MYTCALSPGPLRRLQLSNAYTLRRVYSAMFFSFALIFHLSVQFANIDVQEIFRKTSEKFRKFTFSDCFYYPEISLSDRFWSSVCTTDHGNFLRIFLQCSSVITKSSSHSFLVLLKLCSGCLQSNLGKSKLSQEEIRIVSYFLTNMNEFTGSLPLFNNIYY